MDQEKIFKVAPSGLDYALKCRRCLWLSHKGIKLDAFFPPIFNAFDLIQKKFLITQSVKLMSQALPDLKTTNISPSKIENYRLQLESYATIFQNPNSKTPKFSNVEELGLYLFEPKEITKISDGTCNMKFETLYLKGNRCHDDLINRVTDIIDIYLMKSPPDFNLACASCKFVTSLKKEKYI